MGHRAGIYVRISSDPEGKRLGVTRQLADCRAKAKALGWSVVEVYEDNDVSASGTKPRKAYRQLLADLEARKLDAVVVWDLDRLTRRPIEVEEFIDLADRKKVALASVGGDIDLATDNGRMYARIKGAVARAEVERKGTRQRSANAQRARSGLPHVGRRPFGYTADGMHLVEDEAEHVRRAAEHLLQGHSVRGIAADLNAKGATSTAGGPWRPTELRRMLANPRYAGRRLYLGEDLVEAAWPSILDPGTHAAVLAILGNPDRHKAGPARRYLLSGVATCATCDGRIFGVTEKAKGALYRCESRAHVMRRADDVEALVTGAVVARLSRPDAVELLADPRDSEEAADLRENERQLQRRLEDAAEAFAAGEIDRTQLRTATGSIRDRLEVVTAKLAGLARAPVLTDLLTSGDVQRVWDEMPLDRQRAVIDTLMTIRLHPPGRGARTFDPETVEIAWKTS